MSADNTIVILHLSDQTRVAHLQAMENLFFSIVEEKMMPFTVASRIVERFYDEPVILEHSAREYAIALHNEIGYVEYGIVEISIDKTWEQVVQEAWSLLEKEIQSAYKQKNESYRACLLDDLASLSEILKSEELKLQGV